MMTNRTWKVLALLGGLPLAMSAAARADEQYQQPKGEVLAPGVTTVPTPSGRGEIVCVPTQEQKQPVAGKECGASQVHFDTDSSELGPDARGILKDQADCLSRNPTENVNIVGATDPSGSADHNQKLGEKRADSVSNFLSAHGVASDRIRTSSVGKDEQLCSDKSDECWARNRRASIGPSLRGNTAAPAAPMGNEPSTAPERTE
jgi:peptidoglycan-associated lipoprotein